MSEYDRLHEEYEALVEEAKKRTENTSKDIIPKCCENLKKQGLSNEDLVHRIKQDFDFWHESTIYDAIPDEYKKVTKPKKIRPPESIVIEQSTSGNIQSNEPVTDEPNNNQFGKGVVPMTEEKPKLQNMRMVMSAGQFSGLGKGMLKKLEEKGWNVDYAIEYDANEKALYVDVADKGEARNVND